MWFQERREFEEKLGGVDGGETVVKMYRLREKYIFKEKKKRVKCKNSMELTGIFSTKHLTKY